jgi:hypothetical protein
MNGKMRRREFLRDTAGLTVLAAGGSARGYSAHQKLNVALVGLSGRGGWFVQTVPNLGENVVALCDVSDLKAADAHARYPDAKKFHDFRTMLDEMDRQIDAVIVATPDHTHAIISVAAMKRGIHVYCEKPMTRTVREARVARETARKFKVATQMGNQGTSAEPFRRALELVRAGVLGEVREVHVWNEQGGRGIDKPPSGQELVPDYLKWDLWLGPAAERPFHREWFKWHVWRDFATGNLGNWGPHTANLAFMALNVHALWHAAPDVKPPLIRIEAKVSEINRVSFPRWEQIRFEVPARPAPSGVEGPGMPPVTFHWHNGKCPQSRDHLESLMKRGLDWGDKGEKKWKDWAGLLIVGPKGMIYATGHNATFSLLPEDSFKDFKGPEPSVPRSPGHEREWTRACRGGEPAWSNFDYAGPLVEFLMLGNVATLFEGVLEFDPLAGKIVNNAEADRLLGNEYRAGWSL